MSSNSNQPPSSPAPPPKSEPLALPSTSDSRDDDGATAINNGTTVSMDALGPVVVNTDGTMSRINNWAEMSEIEKRNTLRIIGKRNRERRAALLAKEKSETEGAAQAGDAKGQES